MREVKEVLALSDTREKKRDIHVYRHQSNEQDVRVLDIKDVCLGESGSIQCVVRWKLSLVVKDNLVEGPRGTVQEVWSAGVGRGLRRGG